MNATTSLPNNVHELDTPAVVAFGHIHQRLRRHDFQLRRSVLTDFSRLLRNQETPFFDECPAWRTYTLGVLDSYKIRRAR